MSEQQAASSAPIEQPISEQVGSNQEIKAENGSGEIEVEGHSNEESVDADPSLSKSEKKEIKKSLKKLQLKFNGKQYEEELPFEIPDTEEARQYMSKHLQMSKLSQSKAQEQANLEKEITQWIQYLREDPAAALSDPTIGIDLKKLAASVIEREIEQSKKSPEQVEKEKLELELRKIKEEREKEKNDYQQKELERYKQQEVERYDMLMTQALDKAQLPKNPYIVKKIADYMLLGIENDMDVSPEDVIPLVEEEMKSDLKSMFSVMPDEVLESLIGDDNYNRLRKRKLGKAKTSQKEVPAQPIKSAIKDVSKSAEKEEKVEKKATFKDFFGV